MNVSNLLVINNPNPKSISRIFRKITIDKKTGCWNWNGVTSLGYGQVRVNKQLHRVHRFMYAWLVKPIPKGREEIFQFLITSAIIVCVAILLT